MNEKLRKRLFTVIDVVRSGGLSLREQVVLEPIKEPTKQRPGIKPDYERFLPPTIGSLTENIEYNPNFLRESFAYMLVTMANAYQSLNSAHGENSTINALSDDCMSVIGLARSFDIPTNDSADK
jgi:hypothetical protein